MTLGERRHLQLEEAVARRLEQEGLTLIRAGGLYTVVDGDDREILDQVPLVGVAEWIEEALRSAG